MFKGISIIEFSDKFKTDQDCKDYLAQLKWSQGYKCCKCQHTGYVKGKKEGHRRCQQCGYEESFTSGTLFHKVKFPLLKAFHICFRVCVRKKGMSTVELSKELMLQQKTCWLFKRKIQEAMKSSEQQPLKGKVEVDEFVIGQAEEGQPGRSNGDKTKVVIAVERVKENGIGRAYAKVIADFSAASFTPFFKTHINAEAKIKTDKWRGYLPLKKAYPLLEQQPSENGENFKELHMVIMSIKGWLRGIHHHCSPQMMQCYLDEFCYRFNRRSFPDTMLHKLLDRMVKHKPLFLYAEEN
jgi:hypothetical protein